MAKETVQSTKFASIGRLYPNLNFFTSTDYVSVGRRNINITVASEYPNIRQGYLNTDIYVAVQQLRDGRWTNIATREGYVSPHSPMPRTFTNVNSAYQLRVRFRIDSYAYPSKYFYLGIF